MSVVNLPREISEETKSAIRKFYLDGNRSTRVDSQKKCPKHLRYNSKGDVRCRNKGEFGLKNYRTGW